MDYIFDPNFERILEIFITRQYWLWGNIHFISIWETNEGHDESLRIEYLLTKRRRCEYEGIEETWEN